MARSLEDNMIDVKTGNEAELVGGGYTKLKSVLLSEKIFEEYKEGQRSEWADDVKEDRGFVDSIQWSKENEKELRSKGKPANSINVIKSGIGQIVNQLTANTPRFTSFGSEKSDVTTAAHMADLMSYIWYKSYGDLKLKASATDYEVAGKMDMMIYFDPMADFGKGEIMITDLDPLDVYVSPHCKDPMTDDSPHKLIVQSYTGEAVQIKGWLSIEQLAQATSNEDDDEASNTRYAGEGQVQDIDDLYGKKYRIIDRYTKVLRPFFRVYDLESKSFFEDLIGQDEYIEFTKRPAFIKKSQNGFDYAIKEHEVKNVQKIYDQTGGVFHLMIDPTSQQPVVTAGEERENAIPGSTTVLTKVTIADLLKEGVLKYDKVMLPRIQRVFSVGGILVVDQVLPIWDYPIKSQMLYHNRNPYPYGDVRLVKPLQETLNKLNSLILTNATMATGPTIIIGKNTADKVELEKEYSKVGMKVLEIDLELPGSQPIFVYPQALSNELYSYMGSIRGDIERMIGAYSFQDGDVANAPQTVGGTTIMDEMANRKSSGKRQDIEKMLDALGRVVLQYIPHVYTERKVIRLLAPNNKVKEVTFNDWDAEAGKIINDITVGEYDMRVESGSLLPINRAIRRDYYLNLWDKRVLQDASVILRESEIPNVEEVIEKQDRERQQAQAIEQLEEQIKKLDGDLQRKSAEVVHLGEKLAVEKTKQQLVTTANKVQADATIAKARLNDVVKETKKEKSSSQTVN